MSLVGDDARAVVVVAGATLPSLDPERAGLEPSGVRVVDANGLPREAVIDLLHDADGLLVDYFRCDAELIASLGRCRVICQYGVGLDQIDIEAATAAGIVVTHTPTYCLAELADHTMALLLAVARRVVLYDHSVRAGRWRYLDGMPLHRLAGSTLGLVGFGRVAQAVARRAAAFDLRVVAFDPHVDDTVFAASSVERTSMDDLLGRADLVSVHAALTPTSRHLIGAREFALMRAGAILVNTSRGAVCDQGALLGALESGRLAGVGLDVLEHEPPDPRDPLLRRDDVVVTPHAGFLSVESLADMQTQAAEEVRRVLRDERPRHGVNTDEAAAARGPSGRTSARRRRA